MTKAIELVTLTHEASAHTLCIDLRIATLEVEVDTKELGAYLLGKILRKIKK